MLAPDEAFATLGNETRMAILQTLWDAQEPLSFSDLRTAIGIRDPGRFHYHLDQLTGYFVQKSDEEYRLRAAGEHVVRAVLAGAITENPTFGPDELDSKCPFCGGTAEAWYTDETFTARCTECPGVTERGAYSPGTFMEYLFPPAGILHRTPDEVLDAAHVFYDAKITPMFEGVCPECAGPVEIDFEFCPDHQLPEDGLCETCHTRQEVWITPICQNCRYTRSFVAWFAIATNPAVIAFYHEHGVPWERVPYPKLTWESTPDVTNISEEVVSRNPPRIRVRILAEDDELHVTIDEELNIVDVVR